GDQKDWYPSDFFPETPWDKLENAEIRFSVRQGDGPSKTGELRRASDRWVGTAERPQRPVKYVDMARLQPMTNSTGYFRIAKPSVTETGTRPFNEHFVERISEIMGRRYDGGRMATTDADEKRPVPVLASEGTQFSGFHQGAGELTVAELLQVEPLRGSL